MNDIVVQIVPRAVHEHALQVLTEEQQDRFVQSYIAKRIVILIFFALVAAVICLFSSFTLLHYFSPYLRQLPRLARIIAFFSAIVLGIGGAFGIFIFLYSQMRRVALKRLKTVH